MIDKLKAFFAKFTNNVVEFVDSFNLDIDIDICTKDEETRVRRKRYRRLKRRRRRRKRKRWNGYHGNDFMDIRYFWLSLL